MKNTLSLVCTCLLTACALSLSAQDEGAIVKRERIDKSKSVFLDLGISQTLGKNIGDYNIGFNVEAGFTKRLNRVLSIGPSISYQQFKYDPEKTGINNIFVGGPYYEDNFAYYLGAIIDFKGGDLNLTSLTLNLKFNFIPVKDNTVFSAYAFAKPFVTMVSRTEVKGIATIYENDGDINNSSDWYLRTDVPPIPWEPNNGSGIPVSNKLKADTEVTGGIFVGPGVELFPGRTFSFFGQVAVGYTLPITFVSTKAYQGQDLDDLSEEFPMTKKGFPSWSLQFGASYNF